MQKKQKDKMEIKVGNETHYISLTEAALMDKFMKDNEVKFVKSFGGGIYSIGDAFTNEAGLEMFHEALKKEADKLLNKKQDV